MNQNGIELQVCVDGKPVREFAHDGQLFVEGHEGSLFTLKVRNHRNDRANIVVLVDGVNVVKGDESLDEGYIVAGLSSYEIQGWRTSLKDVSTFIFKTKDGSYAKATTGSSQKCGLISVVAWAEKKVKQVIEKIYQPVPYPVPVRPWIPPYWHPPFWHEPFYRDGVLYSAQTQGPGSNQGNQVAETFSTFHSTSSGPQSQDTIRSVTSDSMTVTANVSPGATINQLSLGTGWGAQKQDVVMEVSYENGERIVAMELYYADVKGLKKMGINMKKSPAISKAPLPTALGSFCRPPA